MAVTEYRCMLIRRTGWQWPLGFGDRLELWDSHDIRVQVEIPALVNLLLAKALEADFVRLLLRSEKKRVRKSVSLAASRTRGVSGRRGEVVSTPGGLS